MFTYLCVCICVSSVCVCRGVDKGLKIIVFLYPILWDTVSTRTQKSQITAFCSARVTDGYHHFMWLLGIQTHAYVASPWPTVLVPQPLMSPPFFFTTDTCFTDINNSPKLVKFDSMVLAHTFHIRLFPNQVPRGRRSGGHLFLNGTLLKLLSSWFPF